MWSTVGSFVGSAIGGAFASIWRTFFPTKTVADQKVCDDEKIIEVQAAQLRVANSHTDALDSLRNDKF